MKRIITYFGKILIWLRSVIPFDYCFFFFFLLDLANVFSPEEKCFPIVQSTANEILGRAYKIVLKSLSLPSFYKISLVGGKRPPIKIFHAYAEELC